MIPELFRPKAGAMISFLPLQVSMVVVGVVSAIADHPDHAEGQGAARVPPVDKPLPIGRQIRNTFTSRSFLVLAAANFMSILMNSLLLGVLFYLADYVLQMNAMILLAVVFIPLIIGVPVTPLIRQRLGVVGAEQFLLVDRRRRADPAGGRAQAADPRLSGGRGVRPGRPADPDQRALRPGGRRG